MTCQCFQIKDTIGSRFWCVKVMRGLCVCLRQAYPEYLITYQILKPESTAQSAAGAEQKS